MSTIITGDCAKCGEPVEVVDGVWPLGHGYGKCVPWREPIDRVTRGPTAETMWDDLQEEMDE